MRLARLVVVGCAILSLCWVGFAGLVTKKSLYIPEPDIFVSSFGTQVIDASGEKAACIFQVPETGTIDSVVFRTGSVTSAQTLRASVETVDASGDPSGSNYGGSTPGTQASPAANTQYVVTLGGNATATAGDFIATVIQFDGTIGNLQISTGGSSPEIKVPYIDLFTASWAKNDLKCAMGVRYTSSVYNYIGGIIPLSAVNSTNYNNASTPDERAMKFRVPFPARLRGAWIQGGVAAAGADGDLVLYDSDGSSVLKTLSIDGDFNGDNSGFGRMFLTFASPQTLTKDTFYYLSWKPTTANNVRMAHYDVSTAGIWGLMDFGDVDFVSATRSDAGSWTELTTRRFGIGLIIDQLDDGTGGGGGGKSFVVVQ